MKTCLAHTLQQYKTMFPLRHHFIFKAFQTGGFGHISISGSRLHVSLDHGEFLRILSSAEESIKEPGDITIYFPVLIYIC